MISGKSIFSFVYILFFNGQMESKIGEANSHIIIFGWCGYILMAISSVKNFVVQ